MGEFVDAGGIPAISNVLAKLLVTDIKTTDTTAKVLVEVVKSLRVAMNTDVSINPSASTEWADRIRGCFGGRRAYGTAGESKHDG